MKEITVIDSGCGSGKTEYAISYINNSVDKRFIFITPYLNEVQRILKGCSGFKEPEERKYGGKYASFVDLVLQGYNIVSTHAMFTYIDDSLIQKISEGGYELILDEVLDVVNDIDLSKKDRAMLVNSDTIEIGDNGEVKLGENAEGYKGKFEYILKLVAQNRVVSVDNSTIVWEFPANILESFNNIMILTYMFKHQTMCNYLRANGFSLKYYYMDNYEPVEGELALCGDIYADLIDIQGGNLNFVGNEKSAFSKTWLESADSTVIKRIVNNSYNFVANIAKAKSKEILWTTFKSFKEKLSGKGYAGSFVQHKLRATNLYSDRRVCMYLLNKYEHPSVKRYFISKGIETNDDIFALSEMIQWIFRSRVRKGEPISVYIPSSRMRNLLTAWLNGTFDETYNKKD